MSYIHVGCAYSGEYTREKFWYTLDDWYLCYFAYNFFLIVKSPCATRTYVGGKDTYKLGGRYFNTVFDDLSL